MKLQSLRKIINAFNVTSDDATRYALTHVCLERSPTIMDSVHIVATNGHMLSKNTSIDSELYAALKDKQWLVSDDLLPALKAIAKTWNKLESIPFSYEDNSLTLSAPGLECKVKASDVSYPNYKAIIPDVESYKVSVGLNPSLLMDVFNALNHEKRAMGIKLQFNIKACVDDAGLPYLEFDKLAPIVVNHADGMGLVMPMRM